MQIRKIYNKFLLIFMKWLSWSILITDIEYGLTKSQKTDFIPKIDSIISDMAIVFFLNTWYGNSFKTIKTLWYFFIHVLTKCYI